MKKKFWTEEEDQYMRDHFPHENTKDVANQLGRSYSSISCRASLLGLSKSKAFMADHKKTGRDNLIKHGTKTRFKKGQKAWNEGKKMEIRVRMSETFFQKGHLPYNTREDGAISIRYSKGRPYKWIRVSLGNWKLLHRVIWEKHKGKIPKGYNVRFKNGDSMNCDIKNLEIVSNQRNMEDNTIHRYPAPIKKSIRTISKLNKAIKNAKK